MTAVMIAYVPVLHRGYIDLFREVSKGVTELFIIDDDMVRTLPHLYKDARALCAIDAVASVTVLRIFEHVTLLSANELYKLRRRDVEVLFPDDDAHRIFQGRYLDDVPCSFLPVFLRWDRTRVLEPRPIVADTVVDADLLEHFMFKNAEHEARRSADWWRSVGAVLTDGSRVLVRAHNEHLPSIYAPYFAGDPRNEFSQGINVELSTSSHAEAVVIATAAREGIVTKGLDLYVTTFPCPPCAHLIARSGVKRLLFSEGYGMLDGADVLRSFGVEIIFVRGISVDIGGRPIPYPPVHS